MCLLMCFPDGDWWTEWRRRAASLRAAKWGRIPGTRWHLPRCKTMSLLSFTMLDLVFRGRAATDGALTASRGERRKRMRDITAHKAILLNPFGTPEPPHLPLWGSELKEATRMQFCTRHFYISLFHFHLTPSAGSTPLMTTNTKFKFGKICLVFSRFNCDLSKLSQIFKCLQFKIIQMIYHRLSVWNCEQKC